ncbi:MAG: acyltransferase [Planctomycetota bacterium]
MGGTPENQQGFVARHLSRRTSGRQLIPEIDGLRSVAIVSVVLFHAAWTFRDNLSLNIGEFGGSATSMLDQILFTGSYGVPVFFVISGFILALPFAESKNGGKPVSLGKYLKRRVTRLEPPFFAALLVAFAVIALQTGSLDKLPNLLASLGYVHSIVYGGNSEVLPVAWSLEVEVQFYLLMPLLALIYVVKNTMLRRTALVAGILGFSIVFGREVPIWGLTVVHQMGYFMAGMLLADLYRTGAFGLGSEFDTSNKSARLLAWDALGAACLLGTFAVKGLGIFPAQTSPWLILVGFIAVFRGGLVRRFFRWSPVVILGGMCYSIYLWHFFVMRAAWPAWEKIVSPQPVLLDFVLFIIVASVGTVAVSTLMFVLIERPTMDSQWPRKLGRAMGAAWDALALHGRRAKRSAASGVS